MTLPIFAFLRSMNFPAVEFGEYFLLKALRMYSHLVSYNIISVMLPVSIPVTLQELFFHL